MRTVTTVWILWVLLAHWDGTVLAADSKDSHTPRREITIETYNLARIGSQTLVQAEQLTTSVFAVAGVGVRWTTGSPSETARLVNDFSAVHQDQCAADLPLTIVRVQFLTRAPNGFSPRALGYALPCAKRGIQVTLYVDRMEAVSYRHFAALDRVLGYALAHETGHVLLRSSTHASRGLMKAVWARDDWQRAGVEVIPFTLDQAKQMAGTPQRADDQMAP